MISIIRVRAEKSTEGPAIRKFLAQMWILRADEGLVTREVTMTGGDRY